MKRWSTTPVSKGLVTKSVIVATAVLMAVTVPLTTMQSVRADKYDDQINALQSEVAQYQAQANKLGQKADSLQSELNRLSAEKAVIQGRIDISQAKYSKLKKQIEETKQRIADNKDALGVTIADMYVTDSVSPLEMLASSHNIGDYVDKQTYRSSISDELQDTIKQINELKAKLQKQKVAVERVLADQKKQKQDLASKEAERATLLAKTRQDKNAYKELASERNQRIAELREQQRLAFQALQTPGGGFASSSPTGYAITYKNWSGNFYCGGGYDYCGYAHDQYVSDPWGLSLARECVHYVADALENRGYYIPYNAFSSGNGYGGGSANKWIPVATGMGFGHVVGNPYSNAQPGDVVYMAVPGVGHVGIVEANYGNGWVKVSQYNFGFNGQYSTMDLKIDGATTFLRIDRR